MGLYNAELQYPNIAQQFNQGQTQAQNNILNQQQQANQNQQVANQTQSQRFNQARQEHADMLAEDQAKVFKGKEDAAKAHIYAQHLAQIKDPAEFAQFADQAAADPAIAQLGITRDMITPESVQQILRQTGVAAGQGPAETYTQIQGPRGSVIQQDSSGKQTQIVGPDNSQPAPVQPKGVYTTLSPQEVAAVGLPPGTSAQKGPDGKIDVIGKRDNTATLNQKDADTAKMKLNTVALARHQLAKIKEAFDTGTSGPNAFGPVQGYLPTQQGKIFDGRVNQMRSTLTALTRVPGVGSMSDYETKLDQAKFPARNAYESVTADTIQNLDDQLALIENGYKNLLGGQQAATPAQQPAAQQGPVKVSTPAEANALPSGTQFVTPDGQVRVKR